MCTRWVCVFIAALPPSCLTSLACCACRHSLHSAPCTAIAAPGDDGNYGSAATLDVLCLQALSKRIHYGKFVAEAKFRCAGTGWERAGGKVGTAARRKDRVADGRVRWAGRFSAG